MARFLARRFGLGGKTDVEQARADMIAESVGDIMNSELEFIFYYFECGKFNQVSSPFLRVLRHLV